MLGLKKAKSNEYVISWKSKDLFEYKIPLLHGTFLSNIKLFQCKIEIQFNNTPLIREENNYATKIVNAYIVYDLDY